LNVRPAYTRLPDKLLRSRIFLYYMQEYIRGERSSRYVAEMFGLSVWKVAMWGKLMSAPDLVPELRTQASALKLVEAEDEEETGVRNSVRSRSLRRRSPAFTFPPACFHRRS